MTDVGVQDAIAPLTSVMHSTATTLNMILLRTQVYCTQTYLDSDAVSYLNVSVPPTSQVNTKFYLESSFNVSVDTSQFTGCGVSLYGGVFWLAAGTPFYDAHSTYDSNSGGYGGVFNVQASRLEMFKTTLEANQAWRGGVIELRDSSYFKGYGVSVKGNLAYSSAGGIYISSYSYMDLTESYLTSNSAPENSAVEVL